MKARIDAEHGTDLTAEVDLDAPAPRTDLHDPVQRHNVERALGSIPGVIGSRLVAGFERQVDELHVLTTLERSPKQTVRDVQTVLMARFGVPTDHRVVSVVQLEESDNGLPVTSRVVIDTVTVSQSGRAVRAEVAIRDVDQVHRGSVEGGASASARQRAVAQATLAAIEPLLEEGTIVDLEGTDLVSVFGRQLAVALLHVRTARTEVTLTGTALVREAAPEAVARAVLDALNRTIADLDR